MFFMTVMAIVCVPLLGIAQDGDVDEEPSEPTAYWHVNIDKEGQTFSNFTVAFKEDTPLDMSVLQTEFVNAFQSSLHCSLDNPPPSSTQGLLQIRTECAMPIEKEGLVVSASINPSTVIKTLGKYGPYNVDLTINVPRLGFSRVGLEGEILSFGSQTQHNFSFSTNDQNIDELPIQFGYHSNYVIALLATVTLLLVAPIALILFIRRRSLILASKDATAAWFGYWRVHRWIVEGGWVIWIIALSVFGSETFIRFLTDSEQPVLNVLILFIPPGLVSFFCQFLARPLWIQTRGITWNIQDMLVRGFWEHVAAILPTALLVIGINSLFQETGTSLYWFAASAIAQPVGAWMHGRISGITPRPLDRGEFRDNTLAIAHRAGVKIKQILLMPTKHLQMGNAFAMQGGRIMITDFLLERLTKQETDCVMAHEIGHVKMRHGLLLSWVGTLLLFGGVSLVVAMIVPFSLLWAGDYIPLFSALSWIEEYLMFPLALLLTLLIRFYLSRRFEHSADEFATLVTGTPEAMITSLVKLSKMNLMPVSWGSWDEQLSTHPSTARRVKAIAERHRISTNRLRTLLATPAMCGAGEGYSVSEEAPAPAQTIDTAADIIEIICPSCAFSRSVPLQNLPCKPLKATCPECAQVFPFRRHLEQGGSAVESQSAPQMAARKERAQPIPVSGRGASANNELRKVIASTIPFVGAILSYACGAPWYLAVVVVLLAPYWYGPFLIYYSQRLPALQLLRNVTDDTSLPFEHHLFFDRIIPVLEGAGFVQRGCFTSAADNAPINGTVTLLQHQETSDIAHLLVSAGNGQSAEMLGFSRTRVDGSRLSTGWSSIPSPLPPPAQDDTLRVSGNIEPLDLWRVHRMRTASDPKVTLNEPVTDALGYQMQLEREGAQARIVSGMWQPAGQSEFIRPTAIGALIMCLRMLFPWKNLSRLRGEMVMRRYLKKIDRGGECRAAR